MKTVFEKEIQVYGQLPSAGDRNISPASVEYQYEVKLAVTR